MSPRTESEQTPAKQRKRGTTGRALLRSELVQKLCQDHPDLTGTEIERVVSAFFDSMIAELQRGGGVELRGFGAFSTREREARNPSQGGPSERVIGPRTEIKFKQGKLPYDYIGGLGRQSLGGQNDTFLAYSESGDVFTVHAVVESTGGGSGGTILSSGDPLVEAAIAAVLERVPEIAHARQDKLSQDNIDLLVDAYLKGAPTAPARHEIEMDNARERARFVEEFACYTSREVAELAGHEAANASATATRWKKARRIVGLPWKGSDLYPAFQFREGRPRPVIGRLIETLPERMSPWQIAFWITSSNSWLGGATPLERLDDETALLAAAVHEGESFEG
jgi:nucleoid DNA-binding protein